MVQELALGMNCGGYLNGIIDANAVYQGFILVDVFGPDTGLFCLPAEGISTEQQARIVIKYLEQNPEKLHLTKRVLVVGALSDAFPCKGWEALDKKKP